MRNSSVTRLEALNPEMVFQIDFLLSTFRVDKNITHLSYPTVIGNLFMTREILKDYFFQIDFPLSTFRVDKNIAHLSYPTVIGYLFFSSMDSRLHGNDSILPKF
ncbi:MAG: hypothetical protein K8S16_14250 [Bacteroidales bacterium]|nr:hypothetical protein [Bacteroidales bacterium]